MAQWSASWWDLLYQLVVGQVMGLPVGLVVILPMGLPVGESDGEFILYLKCIHSYSLKEYMLNTEANHPPPTLCQGGQRWNQHCC